MSYVYVKEKKILLFPILKDSFQHAMKSVHRRIKQRKSIRNSGKISVKIQIHKTLFVEFWKAVKIGFRSMAAPTTKDKKGLVKEFKISFVHKGTFVYHINQVIEEKVETFITRKFTAGSKGVIKITPDTPFVITFNTNRKEMTLKCSYDVVNRYGNVCA